MYDKIKNYVRDLMKGYKISDRQLEKDIISACLDEYELQITKGVSSKDAYTAAIKDVAVILKEKSIPKNKYLFALIVNCVALLISITEMLIAKLSPQPLDVYGFEMPFVLVGFFAIILFVIIKHRNYRWYDFLILAILMLSWIITLAQIGIYAYHATMPSVYWSAEFEFPCTIKILTYATKTYPDVYFELVGTKDTYSFNFILSIMSLATVSVLIIKEKIKTKDNQRHEVF